MKKVVIWLVLVVGISCELPSQFSSRTRQVPPSTRYGIPQTVYGPPANAEPLEPSFSQPPNPSKLSNLPNPYLRAPRPSAPQTIYGAPNRQVFAPQTTYGAPNKQVFAPQTTYGAPNKQSLASQATFGAPNKQNSGPQSTYRVPNNQISGPQAIYEAPNKNIFGYQTAFGAPNKQSLAPQTTYGAPNKQSLTPQASFGAPNKQNLAPQSTYKVPNNQISGPQATYEAPNKQSLAPQTSYGAPDQQFSIPFNAPNKQVTVDYATFEEIRQLKELLLKIEMAQRLAQSNGKHAQSLPNRGPVDFGPSLTQQYLPVKGPENFNRQRGDRGNDFNSNYIPSANNNFDGGFRGRGFQSGNSWNNLDLPNETNRNVDVQKVEVTQFGSSGNRNNEVSTTFKPDANDKEEGISNKYIPPATSENPITVNPSTETPVGNYLPPQNGNDENPNIAVATSVSGIPDDQQFYLLQPDGRYQRIVLPKISDSDPVNYQLQKNVQIDPNVFYTPLYTVINK